MITFNQVSKFVGASFRRRTILQDVDVELPFANFALLGAPGERSVVFGLISGTTLPTRGTVERRVSISWPVGATNVFSPGMSGAENLRFLARVYGRDVQQTIHEVGELVDLGKLLQEPVADYGPEARMRLAYAASAVFEFDLYIVEDLNRIRSASLRGRIVDAVEERLESAWLGMTSSRMGDLTEHCKVGAVVRDGKLVLYDDVKQAISASRANV